MGRTVEEIEAATERDHYLSAAEALDFGLIDAVIVLQNAEVSMDFQTKMG